MAYFVLKSRCPNEGNMTLHDVDTQLTSIAENYAAKKHGEFIVHIVFCFVFDHCAVSSELADEEIYSGLMPL